MSRFPRTAIVLLLPLAGMAQEARPAFIHLGSAKVDPGAATLSLVLEGGAPILRWGLANVGVFGGGTQWRRGRFSASQVRAGDLLDKTTTWAGVYGGSAYWTLGLAGEYARQQVYAVPTPANQFYDGVDQTRAGVGFFVDLHGPSGFGAFVRAGTQSGLGFGLSWHF